MSTTTQTLNSDSVVALIHQQLLYADTRIRSFSVQTISAHCRILLTVTHTINCDATIKAPVILYAVADVSKPEDVEKIVESELLNPIPDAPTDLVAVDAGRGDAINLNWLSSASYFNVYIKDGIVLTKVNPTILENTTSYIAGNLTPDVAVTFVVKAANALGQESAISNEATAIPTFKDLESRFTTFTYEVKVSGNILSDAILSDIHLGYGSDYSTASFILPRDPQISGAPDLDEPVEIKVNNRLVFKGNITTRSDGISTGGLKLSYGCHSTILDMTHVTLTEAPSVARIAQFNLIVPGSDGIRRTYNVANANQILQTFGVGGGPSVYAGYINVVDQTRLAAAELVLSKIGNYKLYHDMSTGLNYAYRFGSHGFSTRQFFIGKNITDYNIRKSNMGIVNSVEIMGYPTLVTTRHKVNLLYGTDPDGKMSAYFIVSGGNIQGIQAFGHSKPKPDIQYDESIQVSILSFEDKFSADMREIKRKEDLAALDPWGFAQTYPVRKKVEPTDPKYALRPAIADLKEYDAEWVTLSGNVVYRGNGEARVYLAEVPKQWHANVRTGKVKRSAIAHNVYPKGIVGDPDKTETVKVLLDYDYAIGSVEVQYTYEAGNLYVRVGSGLPSKSITDPQYQAIEDSVNHVSTSGRVYAEMLSRAYSTLAQLSQDAIGGSITIIGDETMDLRSSVNVGGSILEVSGIDHNFVNGFLTTIALTNEPFVVTPVFAPIYISPAKPNEKNNKLWTTTYDLTNLINLVKDLQKQKEAAANAEKLAPKSSPFTTFQ